MRTQRRAGRTVTLRSVTTDSDDLGDSTTANDDTTILGAIYEPERVVESVDPNEAPVQLSAFFNLPGAYAIDADDVIIDGDTTWAVNGEAQVWLDRTKVPVTTTHSRTTS